MLHAKADDYDKVNALLDIADKAQVDYKTIIEVLLRRKFRLKYSASIVGKLMRFSLFESCKLNDINFGDYIEDVLSSDSLVNL